MACVAAVLAALSCAGLLMAAAIVPAPGAVMPLVVALCVGVPMLLAFELPAALFVLRRGRAVAELRRQLDRLPETPHPLDR